MTNDEQKDWVTLGISKLIYRILSDADGKLTQEWVSKVAQSAKTREEDWEEAKSKPNSNMEAYANRCYENAINEAFTEKAIDAIAQIYEAARVFVGEIHAHFSGPAAAYIYHSDCSEDKAYRLGEKGSFKFGFHPWAFEPIIQHCLKVREQRAAKTTEEAQKRLAPIAEKTREEGRPQDIKHSTRTRANQQMRDAILAYGKKRDSFLFSAACNSVTNLLPNTMERRAAVQAALLSLGRKGLIDRAPRKPGGRGVIYFVTKKGRSK